ncbi:hypothetical protein Dimus_028565 [Dionaea muscipula]
MATLSGMATAARAQAAARRLVVVCRHRRVTSCKKKGAARRSLRKEARPLKWTPFKRSRRPQPMVTGMLHSLAIRRWSKVTAVVGRHRTPPFAARHRRESLVVMVVSSPRREPLASRYLRKPVARRRRCSHGVAIAPSLVAVARAHRSQVADARPSHRRRRQPAGREEPSLARAGWPPSSRV